MNPGGSVEYDRLEPFRRLGVSSLAGNPSVEVPLAAMVAPQRRDLTANTGGEGGYGVLTGVDYLSPALRGFSVTADAGVSVIPLNRNITGIPFESTSAVAAWSASEGAAPSSSDPTFGLAPVTWCSVGFATNVSRKFLKQGGTAAEQLLRTAALNAIGRGVDKAVLAGSGSSGEPEGLATISGTISESGTSLGWSGLQNIRQAVADTGARDADCAFVATPAVRELLATRERASGSGIVWGEGKIDGHPAHVSAECPSASLFYGPWRDIRVLILGGIVFQLLKPYFSTSGMHRVQVFAEVAIVIPRPGSFAKSTSIT
jgi:HK97 family phage major capsid protein